MDIWDYFTPDATRIAAFAQRSERDGFHGLYVTDSQNLSGDCWVALALAAQATSTLHLSTGVTNPLTRHPAITAAAAASVASIAGPRVRIGIGRGDSALSHLGLAPAGPDHLESYVDTLRRYLTGATVDFDELEHFVPPSARPVADLDLGHHHDNSRLAWLTDPPTPIGIDISATGPRVIAAAARTADTIMFSVGASPERIEWAIDTARNAGAGDTTRFGAFLNVVTHPDLDTARTLAAGMLATQARFAVMHGSTTGPLSTTDEAMLHDLNTNYDMVHHSQGGSSNAGRLTTSFIDNHAIIGDPDHCIERLQQLAAAGIEQVAIIGASRADDPAATKQARYHLVNAIVPALHT